LGVVLVAYRLASPALQQLVARSVPRARHAVVPRRLTAETPAQLAVGTVDPHAVLASPPPPAAVRPRRRRRRRRHLGDAAASWTGLESRVGVGVDQPPVVALTQAWRRPQQLANLLVEHEPFNHSFIHSIRSLGPFYGAIAVPSVTRCHCRCCCCGHRRAGGVRRDTSDTW